MEEMTYPSFRGTFRVEFQDVQFSNKRCDVMRGGCYEAQKRSHGSMCVEAYNAKEVSAARRNPASAN